MSIVAQSYKVVSDSPLDIISFEECLVNSWAGEEALLLFYVNAPTVIIGRNQNYWREVSPLCKVPVFRRVSGGGAVYHDEGNLNWALIVPRAIHSQDDELAAVASAIGTLGVYARPGARGGIFVSLGDGETQGKISGTARRFGTRNVLHHGTMLVSADIAALKASLGGIKVFEDSSIASVPGHPVNLSRFLSSLSVEELMLHLSRTLAGSAPETIELADFWNKEKTIARRVFKNPEDLEREFDFCVECEEFEAHRKQFGSKEWIIDRSPPFSVVVSNGRAKAVVRVQEGKIVQVVPLEAGDSVSARYADELNAHFEGMAFDFRMPEIMGKEYQRGIEAI